MNNVILAFTQENVILTLIFAAASLKLHSYTVVWFSAKQTRTLVDEHEPKSFILETFELFEKLVIVMLISFLGVKPHHFTQMKLIKKYYQLTTFWFLLL